MAGRLQQRAEYDTFIWIGALIVCILGLAGKATADMLTVVEFSHPPNYKFCTDSGDKEQLTDGKLAGFPIWTRKETVGWAATTPIAIQLRVRDGSSVQSPWAGKLRLHSAKGLSARVDVPRHVDVYARDPQDHLRLVGSLDPDSAMLNDRSAHWLEIDVVAATDLLVLVLHAAGDYIFLDEIEWLPAWKSYLPDNGLTASSVRIALENSVRRVSREQIQKAELEAQSAAISLPMDAMYVWNQDPWAEVGHTAVHGVLGDQVPEVEVRGYSGEHETLCVGIAVGKAVAANGLRVKVRGLLPQAVRLYELKSVIAANGKQVYDPIVPLDEDKVIQVRSGIPFYLWIDLDLNALRTGDHRFEIILEGSQRTVAVPGLASVKADRDKAKPLRAFNWAYLSDKPIFRNGSAAAQDLVNHGINTFVVHPSEVPGSSLDGSWVIKPNSHFIKTVELAKQRGMLLLYLGWSDTKNPLGFSRKAQSLDPVAKDRLLAWVKQLSEHLSNNNLSIDHWALYPVDEPNRHSLRLVKMVAQVVKTWNPSVQVYVNPTIHATPPIQVQDLYEVESLVDYWQPNLLVFRGQLGEFFKGLQKEWWLYGNPKSPAKLGSPLNDYRMLAWWAWLYGASGVGFWSYSDTGGSSAWDDIDGRRPDWAVVYETPGGVVSSRRWEAFREGLEDYTLLSGATKADVQRIFRTDGLNFDRWSTATVEGVRRALLNTQ